MEKERERQKEKERERREGNQEEMMMEIRRLVRKAEAISKGFEGIKQEEGIQEGGTTEVKREGWGEGGGGVAKKKRSNLTARRKATRQRRAMIKYSIVKLQERRFNPKKVREKKINEGNEGEGGRMRENEGERRKTKMIASTAGR
jgi:hypothetical protein